MSLARPQQVLLTVTQLRLLFAGLIAAAVDTHSLWHLLTPLPQLLTELTFTGT